MKIENKNISLETNETGEINSIKYHGNEILHDGKKYWQKIYPMIWPNISFSNGFVVNDVNYKLPKHGFWKELSWEKILEGNSITLVATHFGNDLYPFSIDIQHNISIEKESIHIKTVFSNLGKEDAYFHFGHHPAFKIDEDSFIKSDNDDPQKIALDGKLKNDKEKLTILNEMPFGKDYDTLVIKEWKKPLVLINKEYEVEVKSDNFPSIQIWKPQESNFVCIEPWYGYNDTEYEAPIIAKDKLDIIKLKKNEVKIFNIEIKLQQKK